MPTPKPFKEETESEYVNRCMQNDSMRSQYTSEKQRNAVCRVAYSDAIRSRFEKKMAEQIG